MSFFKLAEQYFALVRRVSRLHDNIVSKYNKDIEKLMSSIDSKMTEYGNASKLNSSELLEFRTLIFRLQDLLDVTIMDEYNSLLDTLSTAKISPAQESQKETKALVQKEIDKDAALWTELKNYLKNKMNKSAFSVWVEPTEFLSLEGNELKISVENFFYKRFLEENCSPLIRKYIDENHLEYSVHFVA